MEKVHPVGALLDPEYFVEAFRERLIQIMEREREEKTLKKAQEKDTGEGEQGAEQADDPLKIKVENEEEIQSDEEEEEPRANPPINRGGEIEIVEMKGEMVRYREETTEGKMSELPDREEGKQPCFLETTQLPYNQKCQPNGLDLEDLCPFFFKSRKDYKRRKIF